MKGKKMNKKKLTFYNMYGCLYVCIGINKDNAIRNPNILSMHLREQQKIKTNQTEPNRTNKRIIERNAGYALLQTASNFAAICPKAECVLTTDAKNPTHYHRIFGSTVCSRFTT